MELADDTNATPVVKTKGIGEYISSHLRQYGLLFALIAVMAFFEVVTDGTLLRAVNITNLLLQNSYIIIMALGMLIVIVSGNIDLSVGSVMGFIGALAAVMIVNYDQSPYLTMIVCLAIGGLIGAAQGYWVAYWKIPSFIVTLAGMLVFRGLSLWLLEGQSVGPFPKEFQIIATGFVPDLFPAGIGAALADLFGARKVNVLALATGIAAAALVVWIGLRQRAQNKAYGIEDEPTSFFVVRNVIIAAALIFVMFKLSLFRGLPNVLITMGILTIIYAFITETTTVGRRIYALGGNQKAAKLSGIKTERLTFLAFTNMGVLAAAAGLVFAARLNTATPKAGFALELDVIAAVFIGGASMSGGVGTIIGAVVGAFLMGVLNNGMSIMGIGIDYQQMIKGLVLLAAVIFDVYNKNKQG
ncbi:multiple monosaccharide ABC transporter permease [Roseibium aggregatum]|jgi:putative multiple sugar transport system permease protein|uniref:Xylose transport system permease protein XylH n=1 Tax=Roseibium aggregatum (strain ATCC 25650 / DSM 13394 / JCM 20685 / NBRC 16684 / NCIMB 2208 / IAM 12614 / B1) TaxID=384765 RepID=A0P244_ROSAI|nr:multiple monosaccharide ABC transporter permease [Roseibium aggregatum]EAV40900.1 ABC transporter, membrane spanning protein (sugar) [Stappia aggregata IAM 12614] [Roseibium aggregatum IAM 12614]